MASSDKRVDEHSWMVRLPLQIEQLRRELPCSEETERHLRELQRFRENVDAVVFALSNRELAADRRGHLLDLLVQHQDNLDRCLRGLGVISRVRSPAPLWYFNRLDPLVQHHLTSILGVTDEPAYHEVLETKAEEYLAQQTAFEALADELDFDETARLVKDDPRPALVLTLSGSLIQLSAPQGSRGQRRYLYQNIYGNTHPPDGVLLLDRDVRPGHRLRSVELTTSPVRLLRVTGGKVSWRAQSQNFDRVARTLSSLVSRPAPAAERGPALSRGMTGIHRRQNSEAARRVFSEDNRELLARFERLRAAFDRHEADKAYETEAELLTLCHRLQIAAQEFGFAARPLMEVAEFVTQNERRYVVDPTQKGRLTLTGQLEVVYSGVSVGRQQVTCQAPLALVGSDGGLVEVTAPVVSLVRNERPQRGGV